ncbi:auxin efflux carrier [Lactarius akahatsu]|uniref:Auxin efflux carrier n=1 Tax=Lactarius akahatsu TaxID=416441 RepID=A0AAD4QA25_9AGAM|nr:auxin efflux carrier [Lactarius akahatsu]
MISTGALIWTSIRPLVRTFLSVGAGFALTRADLFSTEAARGVAQIVLNISMPCLLFSRIVPSFNPQNIGSLAPLTVVGLLYGVVGGAMAWIIKQFFWVPHRFRYGILAAGIWGNFGDMPTAIAMGITASAPFRGIDDENLAIAYISTLILVFFVTLFPLGGFLIVAKDFDGPDVESEELRERMRLRRRKMVTEAALFLRRFILSRLNSDKVVTFGDAETGAGPPEKETISFEDVSIVAPSLERHTTHTEAADSRESTERKAPTDTSPTLTIDPDDNNHIEHLGLPEITQGPVSYSSLHQSRSSLKRFLTELLKPAPIVIVFAIVIALVNPLKALFLPPSANFQPRFRPVAPDGQPPLAFLLDFTTFVGAASVPIGLVCLGSALARLRVGSDAGDAFPRGAIAALALVRMILTPILGVAVTRFFTRVGFVDREDKVLQFVCIVFSGLPTATTQVYLTQVYSPTGSTEHLSAFLIPQYILMPFTMTGLVTYTLNYLF